MADSFNELFGLGGHSEDASIEAWWPLQDDAAGTSVDDVTSNAKDATLSPDNTSDLSVAGPNSWLAKAFDCGLSSGNAFGTFSDITLADGPITVLWRHKPPGGTASQWVLGNGGDNFQLAIVNLGANNLGFRSASAGAEYRWTDSNINDSSTWRSWGITTDGTSASAYKDAVDMGAAGTASGSDFSSVVNRLFRRSAATYFKGLICDISVWTRELSAAEVSQWHSGPELRSTASGIVFSDDGTFNIGTWALPSPFAAGSNGSQTQEVIAVNAAGSVLDTASTAMGTLDLSSEAGNTCYLLARVSNSGGYDIGDHGSRTSGYGSADDGYYELASVVAASAGPTYSLSVDAGAYAYAGSTVGLTDNQLLAVDAGAYAYAGSVVALQWNRSLAIDAGSYPYAGSSVGLTQGRRLAVDAGAYQYTGADVTLSFGLSLSVDTGAYAYSGDAVGLALGRRLQVDAGSYAYAGSAVGLAMGWSITIDAGSYPYTGADVGLSEGSVLPASYLVNRQGQSLLTRAGDPLVVRTGATYYLPVDSGSYSYAGSVVGLTFGLSLSVDAGAYSYAGSAVGLSYHRLLTVPTSNYAYAGSDVALQLTGASIRLWYYHLMLGGDPLEIPLNPDVLIGDGAIIGDGLIIGE